MRALLALITLNGLNITVWGCVGVCRLIYEKARRIEHLATAVVLATLLASLACVLLLTASLEPLGWLTLATLDHLWPERSTTPVVFAVVAPVWIVLCGAATSYLAARLFDASHHSAVLVLHGALCWLGVAALARDAVEAGLAFYEREKVLLLLFGLTMSSCYLGLVLARRRARRTNESARPHGAAASSRMTPDDVAILIAAHNEEEGIRYSIESAAKIVPASNIFVGSDGSTDGTAEIARALGCNVLDIQPNRGKARALATLIEDFAICERFQAVLLLDADSEIDEHYLERALPLFDDPENVAVAGHAIPKTDSHWRPRWSMFFVSYRIRLYRITQALLRYGQTWKVSNVSFIVPGFASMYRCSVLPHIDITAPGLIIEDFNMTFELHRKRLGKIAYSPGVRCISHEPHSLRDFYKQVRRWHLGFWQTVRLHGFWPSFFWLALGTFAVEMLLQSVAFLSVPFLMAWFLIEPGQPVTMWLPTVGAAEISLIDVAVGVFLADYALTVLVSILERRPGMLLYGIGFSLLRWADTLLFLYTLPLAFVEKSDGRWVSPKRN